MKNIKDLIKQIKKSNLSKEAKAELISILQQEKPDINQLLLTFYTIWKVSKEILPFFDIDIGPIE